LTENNPDLISSVAASISDGVLIEWEQVAQQVAGDDDAVLAELQLVERIARFHQDAHDDPAPTGPVAGDAPSASDPRSWAHFLILGRIGSGSYGDVYRVHDTKLQCDVALKLMRRDADSATNVSRVLKEARHLARVRHANVVTVYGADQVDGRVGLWMELVRGTNLEQQLQRQGLFGAREASLVGLDLCRAVAAVHRAGLLHGDIKAHNVMREEGGRTVLMDFGAGKDLDQDVLPMHVRGSHDFAGTPLYLAPEVFAGSRRTKAADVYSLGVLLFHLVTNRYPVEGQTRAAIEEAHRQRTRTHLRDIRPDLPEEFISVVERALDPDARQRFMSAGAFENALARFLGAPVENPSTWPRPAFSLSLAAAIVAIVVGMPAYWLVTRSSTPPATEASVVVPTPVAPATAGAASYSIDAGFYRISDAGESKLRPGDRVAPGDRLALQVQVSRPTHIYVVNEDDMGESYLLFPLPDQTVANPITPGRPVRLPAGRGKVPLYWKVTSAGGREHFLIFATPEPLPAFDRMFASLAHPQLNAPVLASPLSADAVGLLRGVGGLTSAPRASDTGKLAEQFTMPLPQSAESANGLWVRQITLENPR
jgi:eukaryotic-like serine/threonine-protein kinase